LILIACLAVTENQLRYWRTDEALFAHAVNVTKDNEIAHINLGVVYEKQGQTAEAMNEYRQALKINPRRANNHNNIADLLDEAGRPDEAAAEYQTALQLKPDAIEAHLNLGNVFVELERFDEAAGQFQRAAKLKPADARPHYELAKLLLKQGRDAAAISELHQALQREPDNEKILAFTARVLAADENPAMRDGRAALEFATRAREISGDDQPTVLDALGMACAETGDFTNAQIFVQKILNLATTAQMTDIAPMQKRLEFYQNRRPWRESFRETNGLIQIDPSRHR
jgi:tetratricopeptide (TPR) repeat protein